MVVEDLHESDNSCEIVNTATPGGTSNCLRRNRKEGTTAVLEALTQQISATRVELVSHCEDVVRLLGTAEQQLRRGGMQLEKCRDAAVATPPTASLLRPAPSFSPSHDGKNAARTEWRKLTWSSDVEREQGTYPASRALVTRQECPLRPDGFVAKPPSEKEGAVSTACSQKKHSRVMSACQSIEKFESPRDVKKSGTPQAWLPVPQRHSNTAPRIAPVEATDDGIQPNELSPELVESRSSLNLYTEQADRWLQRSKQVADLSRQLRDTDGQESSASEEESQPALFRDLQDMKDKVKQGLVQKKENQVDIYTESLCGRIAQAPWFENSALWVIAINSIWMAFEADYRDDASDGVLFILFLFMDNFFCVFFTLEIIVRFLSFKSKRSCVNFWFMFDFCMAVMMVFETWVLSLLVLLVKDFSLTGNGGGFGVMRLLRLLRLTRMARMMRLMRALPELLILIKGIAVATRSVFFTMCLLGFVVYIFAILFSTITDGTELHTARFKDIPTSILTLLLRGTLPDFADLAEDDEGRHSGGSRRRRISGREAAAVCAVRQVQNHEAHERHGPRRRRRHDDHQGGIRVALVEQEGGKACPGYRGRRGWFSGLLGLSLQEQRRVDLQRVHESRLRASRLQHGHREGYCRLAAKRSLRDGDAHGRVDVSAQAYLEEYRQDAAAYEVAAFG
eukprot:TRINITY_DN11164_c0_g1_i1.p1 TRINITY_DN11164_c0_g1~~TRINITY_DN11164_c0_g1_i1.p1  ORF type:complete len:719 (+),score=105.97 TRINITY_DN11164_c0_g1_i1:122-2158(+)